MDDARILASRLAELLRREQIAMAEFLAALSNFDRLRSWSDLGYSSLFDFLRRELGLSAGAAYCRKTAAELLQKFPEILEPLRDGRLCITNIVQLAKVLTPENSGDVLPRFFQCSKREAKTIAAELQPATAPAHRDVITPVRPAAAFHPDETPSPGGAARALPFRPDETPHSTRAPAAPPFRPGETPVAPRASSEPLTGSLSRLHITVSNGFLKKLDAARDALSHALPGAKAEAVLEAGLDLLLKQHARRKGLVDKPRKITRPHKADTITAAAKREVWNRDGGRCQWPLDSGGVCGSTLRVELDHWPTPRALGGLSTADNMRLLCRFHNDMAARKTYGDHWMNQFTANPSDRRRAPLIQGVPSG
jgi:hypothetical protein